MTQGSFRLALGVAALAALWIVVYWWTPTAPRPSIAFQSSPSPAPPIEEPSRSDEPPAPKARPRPAVTPPSFYQHVVARGDSAPSISKRYYGTAAHAKAVMRANPKTDFENLRVGMTIRVPVDTKNIQGIANNTPPKPDAPVKPVGTEYTVETGDTLTGIAFRFYGRASVYQWIIDANTDQLGADGTKLRAGMKVIIPPAPEGRSH